MSTETMSRIETNAMTQYVASMRRAGFILVEIDDDAAREN